MKIIPLFVFYIFLSPFVTVNAVSNSDRLMNWAETAFSNLFAPKNRPTEALTIIDPQDQFVGQWLYRFYPLTESYIAIRSTGDVLILNSTIRPEPFVVGRLATLLLRVPAEIKDSIPEISETKDSCVKINIPKEDYIAEYQTTGDISALVILNNAPLLIPASTNDGLLTINWLKSNLTTQQYRLKFVPNGQIITEWGVNETFEVIDEFRYRTHLTEISRSTENNATYTPALQIEPILTYCDNQNWDSNQVTEMINGTANESESIILNGQVNNLNEILVLENATYTTVKTTVIDQNQQKIIRWIDIKTGTDAKREVYDSNDQLIFSMQRRD